MSINGSVTNGTKAAAAFHAVTAKKLYSMIPLPRSNSSEIMSEAVVMDVALRPTTKVTTKAVDMTVHFFQLGHEYGLP